MKGKKRDLRKSRVKAGEEVRFGHRNCGMRTDESDSAMAVYEQRSESQTWS